MGNKNQVCPLVYISGFLEKWYLNVVAVKDGCYKSDDTLES